MLNVGTTARNPLTPALSPSEGERENHRQVVGKSGGVEIFVRRNLLFPLPIGWGKDRGGGQIFSINRQRSTLN